MKSTKTAYGSVARLFHWSLALLILVLIVSGFRAGFTIDPATKLAALRLHVPVAILTMILTVLRIVWWRFDRKPEAIATMPNWQNASAQIVHKALYFVTLILLISGVGLSILSGLPDALFGGAPLPVFSEYPPRLLHGIGARLLTALILIHAAAGLYHHFVKKDDSLRRMWQGKTTS